MNLSWYELELVGLNQILLPRPSVQILLWNVWRRGGTAGGRYVDAHGGVRSDLAEIPSSQER